MKSRRKRKDRIRPEDLFMKAKIVKGSEADGARSDQPVGVIIIGQNGDPGRYKKTDPDIPNRFSPSPGDRVKIGTWPVLIQRSSCKHHGEDDAYDRDVNTGNQEGHSHFGIMIGFSVPNPRSFHTDGLRRIGDE